MFKIKNQMMVHFFSGVFRKFGQNNVICLRMDFLNFKLFMKKIAERFERCLEITF